MVRTCFLGFFAGIRFGIREFLFIPIQNESERRPEDEEDSMTLESLELCFLGCSMQLGSQKSHDVWIEMGKPLKSSCFTPLCAVKHQAGESLVESAGLRIDEDANKNPTENPSKIKGAG